MKKFFIISTFYFITLQNYAQSAYHGGEGDGYAFSEVFIENAGIKDYSIQSNILYPNPVLAGQHLYMKTKVSNLESLQYSLKNILGETLLEGYFYARKSDIYSFPFVCYEKGIYFLSIQDQYVNMTFKLVVN